MAEKDAGHSMFGLNNDETTRSMNDPGPTQGATPPGSPQYSYPQQGGAAPGGKMMQWLVVALAVLAVVNLALLIIGRVQFSDYATKQGDAMNLLTRRMDSNEERYAQLRGQLDVTSEKLGVTQQDLERAHELAEQVQKQQQSSVKQLSQAISQKASAQEVNKMQADANTKIGGLSTDLDSTKQDLANTKSEFTNALTGTKGELSGAIARTHDELVALAHRSDRDYFEFSLPRKKAEQKVGTITVQLEKTDTKRNVFSINLGFDDKVANRSNHAIDEPLYFYVQGASSALELVVNKLGKDSISGYISTPKGFFPTTTNVLGQRPGS